jgi:hypothetical protein
VIVSMLYSASGDGFCILKALNWYIPLYDGRTI